MLATQLPGIRTQRTHSNEMMLEAAALVQLTSYNLMTHSGRSFTSFRHAFNITASQFFQRNIPGFLGGSGIPAWSIHRVDDGSEAGRIHVAIEGITTAAQVNNLQISIEANQMGMSASFVAGKPFEWADIILAVLATHPYIVAARLANPRFEICFSGHSIGAVVAEICAYKFGTVPIPPFVLCYKFNPINTGNTQWYNWRRRIGMRVRCVRTHQDPAHIYPNFDVATRTFLGLQWPTGFVAFALDPDYETLGLDGNIIPGRTDDLAHNGAMLRLFAAQTMTNSNPWLWHVMKSFRRMLQKFCFLRETGLGFYRYDYLEMPDENNQQYKHDNNVVDAYADYRITIDPPEAIIVPSEHIDSYLFVGPARIARGEIIPRNIGNDGGGGGDDPFVPIQGGQLRPPLPSTLMPRRPRRDGLR